MFISRIAIRNFRNFADFEVGSLCRGTVFVGENGAGKSNLLYGLRLALDAALPDARRVLRAEDFWSGLAQPLHGEVVDVEVELRDWEADTYTKAQLADCVLHDDPLTARVTYRYRPRKSVTADDADATSPDGYEWIIFGGESESMVLTGSFRRWLSLRVLPALRDAESDLETWRRSPLADLLDRLAVPAPLLEQVAAKVDEAGAKLLTDPGLAGLTTEITAQIEAMVGALFAVPTKLGMTATRPEQVLRAVRLMIDDPATPNVGDVSLGTANVLFLGLLLRSVVSQRAERISTILAVEEPEAHLHPHVQRVLFRYLLTMDVPIIVTTHSAHIASVTDPRALVLLRSEDGQSAAYTIADSDLTDQQIDDLDRYLDVTRSEMLFAKAVVLAEGAAELYVIPAFASAGGTELDELGITVAAVHGTDFAPYRKLLTALGIPCVVVTDGDADIGEGDTGLRRGAALLRAGSKARQKIEQAIGDGDFDTARDLLAKRLIFVGKHTLEADLAETGAEAMAAAYAELAGDTAAARLRRYLDDLGSADSRAKLVRRIERIGKGRFAQRLAAHLGVVEPPAYLAGAISAAVGEVTG